MKNTFSEEEDFKKKREYQAIKIRREKRDQIFNKKRFSGNETDAHMSQDPQKKQKVDKLIILDDRFEEQIRQVSLNTQLTGKNYEGIAYLLKTYYDTDIKRRHRAVIGFRKITSRQEDSEAIEKFVKDGFVDKAIQMVNQKQYPQLRFQSTWILANVASGSKQCCQTLVDKGVVDLFVNLVLENTPLIVDQAIWGIGNLGAQSAEIRDKFLKVDTMTYLIKLVTSTENEELQKNTIWAICNLCRGSPRAQLKYVAQAIPLLCKAAVTQRLPDEIQGDCYLSISSMTQIREDQAKPVVDEGLLPILIKTICTSTKSKLYIPALKVIGNMSLCDELVGSLVQNNIFEAAMVLLDHKKMNVRREICWILSNVLSFKNFANKFLDQEHLRKKISHKFKQQNPEVKRQICWMISNLVHTAKRKIILQYMIQEDIMLGFAILIGEEAENFTKQCCLECLGRILKIGVKWAEGNVNIFAKKFLECGGGTKLQSLQYSQVKGIYERVNKILQSYFQIEDTKMVD